MRANCSHSLLFAVNMDSFTFSELVALVDDNFRGGLAFVDAWLSIFFFGNDLSIFFNVLFFTGDTSQIISDNLAAFLVKGLFSEICFGFRSACLVGDGFGVCNFELWVVCGFLRLATGA